MMLAIEAPHDQPHPGRGGVAERHRRAGGGFHREISTRVSSPVVRSKLGEAQEPRESFVRLDLGYR